MEPHRIRVRVAGASYEIVCAPGALARAAGEIRSLGEFTNSYVLSSPRVWRAVGSRVRRGLGGSGRNHVVLFDDREAAKKLCTVESLSRALTRAGADRRSLLVAVGGGVVGDVAGFVAATYLRGVAIVHVPTTLVAQVDSAIGGKTGVNLPEGKNLVGAFYQPRLVLADPVALRTLPQREYRGGLAEVAKYGAISDRGLFAYLENNFGRLLKCDAAALGYVIPRCAAIKAGVVSKDERESGLREILNFGHTFGHALESLTRYRCYQHGEAVAWGMMAAALLGHEAGITPADDAARLISLVRRLGNLPPWPKASPDDFVSAMRSDKKARHGKLRFVLIPALGKARSYGEIPEALVRSVVHFAPNLLKAFQKRHG